MQYQETNKTQKRGLDPVSSTRTRGLFVSYIVGIFAIVNSLIAGLLVSYIIVDIIAIVNS